MSYWTWFYSKSIQENKEFGSRSDRRLTQVGTKLKGFVFRRGYAVSFARLFMRGSRLFLSVGGGGLFLYYDIYFFSPQLLILQREANGLFQGNL